jgi:hypothetical protein
MPVIALLMDKVHNLSFFSFYVFIRDLFDLTEYGHLF